MSDEREHWTLPRIHGTSSAMYGEFKDGSGHHVAFTVERPWKDNAPDESCIPAGTYECRRRWSAKHGCDVFEVRGVPNRSDIEIHPANIAAELLGCIAPGTVFGEAQTASHGSGYGVLNSRAAFATIMAHFAGVDAWLLTVTDPPATAPTSLPAVPASAA